MRTRDRILRSPPAPTLVRWVFWAGLALVTGTTALGGGWGVVPFSLWGLLPWLALRLLPAWRRDPWPTSTAAILLLLGEAWVRSEVFLVPKGSTAALLLLFSPVYLLLVMVLGLGLGFVLGWFWRRTRTLGHAVLVATGLVLAALLAAVALAPGLLPRRMARAVSTKERVGPPRVITGAAWLRRVPVSPRSAWYLAGELDAEPGDEIAEIGADAVILRDPATFAEKSRRPLSAEGRRRWTWSSQLVRDGEALFVVNEGGGFQDVEVMDLEGRTRWRFRPDPALPPIALRPADLDQDGRPEFYAASGETVYRLDGTGAVAWSARASRRLDALDVHAGPSGGRVVGIALGQPAEVWDATGRALGTVEVPRAEYRYHFVDWPEPFCLIGGPNPLRVVDPEGRVRLQFDLGDFNFSDALPVSWDGNEYLALLGAAPRDTGKWRILVLDPKSQVVYDEVLARGGRLLATRDGEGRPRLFLAGDGLVAYDRPPAP